ncbi:MAG: hypothetical protein DMF86_20755, partial [Acidobacteria bacterium]
MESAREARLLVEDAIGRLKRGEPTPAIYLLSSAIPRLSDEPDDEHRFWLANALFHLGVALEKGELHEKALGRFTECVARFGDSRDEQTSALIDEASISAGLTAVRAGRLDEALQYLEKSIERRRDASNVDERRALSRALINRAAVVRKTARVEEAALAYEAVSDRLRADDDPVICRDVAVALHEKARMLEGAGLADRAAAAFRAFLAECGSSPDPAIAERVLEARSHLSDAARAGGAGDAAREIGVSRQGRFLVETGANQLQQNELKAAIEQCEAAIRVFGDEVRGEDRTWLAHAMNNRASALERLNRDDEALAAYGTVIERFAEATEREVRSRVTSALINAATVAGAIGRFDEALESIETVVQRIGDASGMQERRSLANAMYNRATVLKFASRVEEAVAAFDATAARFASDQDPHVHRFVALALYNKAAALAESGSIDRSVPAFRATVAGCSSSTDPVVRERVARALYGLTGSLLTLGRVEEANAAIEELIARFGSAPEPAVQEIIGRMIMRSPELIARLAPAAHAWDSAYNRQMFGSLINELRDHPEALDRALGDHERMLNDQAARSARGHAEAIAVLDAWWTRQKPFALFLRNFVSEASDIAVPMGLEFPFRAGLILPGYSHAFEARVQAALGTGVPVISISNPSPHLTASERIPKLELNNHIWPSVLDVLIDAAGLIVMWMNAASPGVFDELNAIVTHGRQDSTMVIVSASVEEQVPVIAELRKAQLEAGGAPADPAIPRFALVINQGDLPEEGGTPLPQVTNLVERLGLRS